MATLFTPFFQPVDANGNPLAGAKLYFYQTGTSTPLNTYTTSALTVANANPVVADSAGRFGPIYLGTSSDYKITLKDSTDTTIATVDPYFSAGSTGRTTVADVNYLVAVTDRFVAYTTLTAARTVTLPAASSFPAGTPLTLVDEAGGATAVVTLSFAPNGTDTINGTNTTKVVVGIKNGTAAIESDGSTKWTLTKISRGPTTQSLTSGTSATYTTGVGATALRVRAWGAGGGGAGANSAGSFVAGSTGGTTTFNSITAIGGSGGTSTGAGGIGGISGSGTAMRLAGTPGGSGTNTGSNLGTTSGNGGGRGGGIGNDTATSTTGAAGAANTGGGGAGGWTQAGASFVGGAGGGQGEYAEFWIINPATTYTYTIGTGGGGGSSTGTGGAGASGFVFVEEYYS